MVLVSEEGARTPVWAAYYRIVIGGRGRRTRNTEVRELDSTVLVRKEIRTLDVAMDDTLFVQVYEPFEDLRDVHGDEVLRELAKPFDDVVQRAILAESE